MEPIPGVPPPGPPDPQADNRGSLRSGPTGGGTAFPRCGASSTTLLLSLYPGSPQWRHLLSRGPSHQVASSPPAGELWERLGGWERGMPLPAISSHPLPLKPQGTAPCVPPTPIPQHTHQNQEGGAHPPTGQGVRLDVLEPRPGWAGLAAPGTPTGWLAVHIPLLVPPDAQRRDDLDCHQGDTWRMRVRGTLPPLLPHSRTSAGLEKCWGCWTLGS